MPIYLLRPKEGHISGYDCYHGFLIEAETSKQARRIAQMESGDETVTVADARDPITRSFIIKIPFWTDSRKTTCRKLKESGKDRIIIADYLHG